MRFVVIPVAAVAAACVVWGAIRALAVGEQQPARVMIVFGALAFAACVPELVQRLGERKRRRRPRRR